MLKKSLCYYGLSRQLHTTKLITSASRNGLFTAKILSNNTTNLKSNLVVLFNRRTFCDKIENSKKSASNSDGLERELYYEKQVVRLVLNVENTRNLLSLQLLDTLIKELKEIDCIERVRVVILAAKGPAFSAGHDLNELVKELKCFFD